MESLRETATEIIFWMSYLVCLRNMTGWKKIFIHRSEALEIQAKNEREIREVEKEGLAHFTVVAEECDSGFHLDFDHTAQSAVCFEFYIKTSIHHTGILKAQVIYKTCPQHYTAI